MSSNMITASAIGASMVGASYITFKIFVAGLFLAGTLVITGPNTLSVDFNIFYSNIDLGFIGLNGISIPTPGEVTDVKVEWVIYDSKGGEQLNSGSYYIPKIEKMTPVLVKQDFLLSKNLTQITEADVWVKVQGTVLYIPISHEERINVATTNLQEGFSFSF